MDPHPGADVDLACLPVVIPGRQARKQEVPGVMCGNFAAAREIYEGASIMTLGYPEIGVSARPNAIVRQGIVSCVSPSRPEAHVFLIDSHVFPGNSGGPVFKLPAGIDRQGRFAAGEDVTFLGIVTQARVQQFPMLAGEKEVVLKCKGRQPPELLLAPNFIGIGVVEPALHVKELLAVAAKSMKK